METTWDGKRWWQRRPGRWQDAIEDALASDSPDRIAIAWAIVYRCGGGHGAMARAAVLAGITKQKLGDAIWGTSRATLEVRESIASGLKVRLQPFHPFGFPGFDTELATVIEPGDPGWPAMWEMARREHPELPTREKLVQERPDLFPSET